MLTNEEFYIQSLRDHLYYLRSIKEFCLTIGLSFYKTNPTYIEISKNFASKCEELGTMAISYTNGFASKEAIEGDIYVTEYTLPCEELTEKLFGINIDTVFTKEELSFREGINPSINDELINKVKDLNRMALTLAENFTNFCTEVSTKMKSNQLFSFSYLDFFNYVFSEVSTYINDLKRIISMESFSPIYATNYEYNFVTTLYMTSKFIRDWVDPIYKDTFNLSTYYVNSFNEIINLYLKSSLSPDVQENISNTLKDLLIDYQKFIRDLLEKLINSKIYFITPPISIDNIYTSVNFYKFILNIEEKEVE